MKVTRLPIDTGVSGWNAILPDAEPATPLTQDKRADTLIIGGGFAGLSAARALTQLAPSGKVVLLDATRIGEGPAGRNSGFMIDLPHELSSSDYSSTLENDQHQIKLNRQGIAFAKGMAKEFGLGQEVFNICGKINGAVDAPAHGHNEDYAKHLDALGETYEMLDSKKMQALTGSSFYHSGLFTPGTAMIQPAAYIRGIAAGLSPIVDIHEQSPVVSLTRENGKWIAMTPKAKVTADKVILATNGHIESFGHFKRRVFHIMLFASMTRALSDDENAQTGKDIWGITPSHPAATTMRKISGVGGTRIITRCRAHYSPVMHSSETQVKNMGKSHITSFNNRYPQLAHIEQEYSWAGRLCLSRNSVSAFGEVDEGLISACCQNGLGTVRGTLTGIAAAQLAVQGETELVSDFLSKEQPQKLPPKPLDSIGASAFIRWSEFKARQEL